MTHQPWWVILKRMKERQASVELSQGEQVKRFAPTWIPFQHTCWGSSSSWHDIWISSKVKHPTFVCVRKRFKTRDSCYVMPDDKCTPIQKRYVCIFPYQLSREFTIKLEFCESKVVGCQCTLAEFCSQQSEQSILKKIKPPRSVWKFR